MIARTLIALFFCCSAIYSQAIKAGDNLLLPVNPPRSLSPVTELYVHDQAEIRIKLDEARSELKTAIESGLAKDHPKVKSLLAVLAVLQAQTTVPGAPKRDTDESTQLRIQIEVLKQKTEKDHDALMEQIAEMRSDISTLRKELSEIQKKTK